MARFPSEKSVGDLLALGVNIDPVQEDVVENPGGHLTVAVWGLPDPMPEAYHSWYVDGMPVVIPVFLNGCEPDEPVVDYDYTGGKQTVKTIPLSSALHEDLVMPLLVGEMTHDVGPCHYGQSLISDDHYGKPPWDIWPITDTDRRIISHATLEAIADSGYEELCDFLSWENGYSDPFSAEEEKHVKSVVLGNDGELKEPEEFTFKLKLPTEQRYIWDRLLDLSQQGWLDYGMALPAKSRPYFFYPNGETPWF